MQITSLDLSKRIGKEVLLSEPMSSHTTFKMGGNAQFYTVVERIDDLILAVKTAHEFGLPVFLLGSGSNIIVSEDGIKGLVIKNNCRKFEKKGNEIEAESGTIINQVVRLAIENGLSGFEYSLGLPGTVGGAICMNSNFPYENSFVLDSLKSAKIISKSGGIQEVDKSYFKFVNARNLNSGEIILSVIFNLKAGKRELIKQKAEYALKIRTNSQPKGKFVGLTYRNITGSFNFLKKIKGMKSGGVMVSDSDEHFLLNLGAATSRDVITLADTIKNEMQGKLNTDTRLLYMVI